MWRFGKVDIEYRWKKVLEHMNRGYKVLDIITYALIAKHIAMQF
jgi:hypothetical protein